MTIASKMKPAALVLLLAAGLQPAAARQTVQATGPYLHRFAAAVFPGKLGGFERTDIFQYDFEGQDISASYNFYAPEGRINLTAYIYPAPPAASDEEKAGICSSEFEGASQVIRQNNAGARVAEDGDPLAAAGVPAALSHRRGYRFSTLFDDREQPVRSEVHIYCYVGGNWFVKYRLTTPEKVGTKAPFESFLRNGPWPGRGGELTVMAGAPPARGG